MKGLNRMFLPLSGLLFCLSVSLRAQTALSAFSLPAIPDSLKNPSLRASYLVAHYWDNFGFADSLQYMNAPVEIEQALVNYIDLFRLVPAEEAEQSLIRVMRQAEETRSGVYFFYNAFEKYLYDLGSPMRNENFPPPNGYFRESRERGQNPSGNAFEIGMEEQGRFASS